MVKPDAARLTFRIGASEEAGKSAREANEAQVKRIRGALAAQPIDQAMMDVQALSASVNPTFVTDANRPGERTLKSKRAETTIHVTVREAYPDKLRETVGRIAELAADNGATAPETDDYSRSFSLPRRLAIAGLGNNNEPESAPGAVVEWLCLNSTDARRAAVKRAVADAMADAQAAVGEAKLKVLEIEVNSLEDEPYRVSLRGNSSNTQGGQIPIRVHVKVSCTY
jgi:uncharacterized protein YggE